MIEQLIFVYNANAGKLNALLDGAHKILSPATYDCDLCSLTFGNFQEKEEWARFRKSASTPMQFLHKDEFLKKYRSKWLSKYDFPAVFSEREGALALEISAQRLQEIDSLDLLKEEVQRLF